ncbi:deoxyribodipyrimidine photo-lyase [Ruegeria sp. HKCCA6948]|uniref:cryptochrome/photolyase family protein n=1 Tax=unclassified Ruegeria TaxID=2625375 RepID=UPI00352FF731
MTGQKPIIMWFRRDLRLTDHQALHAAMQSGRPIVPLFICDDLAQALGAAPKWRLGLGLEAFDAALRKRGSRLILRKGKARDVLQDVVRETGATGIYWSRAYEPGSITRDKDVKAFFSEAGLNARSFPGHLLFEPWDVATKAGQPFRVFTPMWRAVQGREVSSTVAAPPQLPAPESWPRSDDLGAWALGAAMRRGASVVRPHVNPGEDSALDQLERFLTHVSDYSDQRDQLAVNGTSDMAEYLSLGEISPRVIWHRVKQAGLLGASRTDAYLRQLVWREFAYHLMFHTPHMLTENWKREWNSFDWQTDPDAPEVVAWKQARTGVPLVDAGMRQMYVTGRMHNRARMIVASYLTKHLITHWRIGMDWFADCLTDWDPAANAMGWQWVAGSGPDAAPFFRIFNPETQRERFDQTKAYLHRWIAEGQPDPGAEALSYFEAVPRAWGLKSDAPYPNPVVDLQDGRRRALMRYENTKSK